MTGSALLSSSLQPDRTADEGAILSLFMPFPIEGERKGPYLPFSGVILSLGQLSLGATEWKKS